MKTIQLSVHSFIPSVIRTSPLPYYVSMEETDNYAQEVRLGLDYRQGQSNVYKLGLLT